jgi:hypothetical protein
MATGRPAGHHDPVGPDLEIGRVVLDPGQRPLGVGHHPGKVGLGVQPVGHVHDHVALGGQVAKQQPGPDVLVQHAPGAAVQIHHGQPRRRHTRRGLPQVAQQGPVGARHGGEDDVLAQPRLGDDG